MGIGMCTGNSSSCTGFKCSLDTVDHMILLKVLENKFGITDDTLEGCRLYLCPRLMKVHVASEYSTTKTLSFLVLQRLCAGPVLFNL